MKVSLINKEYEWEGLSLLSKIITAIFILGVFIYIIPIIICSFIFVGLISLIEMLFERVRRKS